MVEENGIFGLLGSNGAGKTTTFKMIMGEIVPSYGVIKIMNKDIKELKRSDFSKISYCP